MSNVRFLWCFNFCKSPSTGWHQRSQLLRAHCLSRRIIVPFLCLFHVCICFTLSLTHNTWRWSFVRSARVMQVRVGNWKRRKLLFRFGASPCTSLLLTMSICSSDSNWSNFLLNLTWVWASGRKAFYSTKHARNMDHCSVYCQQLKINIVSVTDAPGEGSNLLSKRPYLHTAGCRPCCVLSYVNLWKLVGWQLKSHHLLRGWLKK